MQFLESVKKEDEIKDGPAGSIIVPARLTRVGVFSYDTTEQFRPENEVFKPESLASLNDIPITIEHPDISEVNPENYKSEVVGHVVNGSVKRSGDYIMADLLINDIEAINLLKNKEMVELSCGYIADEVYKDGTWNNEVYDSIQKNIVYNHLSIVPEGRAGPNCKVLIDSKLVDSKTPNTNKKVNIIMIKLDGKEYVEGSKEHLTALQKKIDDLSSPKHLKDSVTARIRLIDSIKKIVKDADEEVLSEMTEREAKESAILAKFPSLGEILKDKPDDFINGFFDALSLVASEEKTDEDLEVPVEEEVEAGAVDADGEVVAEEKKADKRDIRAYKKITKDSASKAVVSSPEKAKADAFKKFYADLASASQKNSVKGMSKGNK